MIVCLIDWLIDWFFPLILHFTELSFFMPCFQDTDVGTFAQSIFSDDPLGEQIVINLLGNNVDGQCLLLLQDDRDLWQHGFGFNWPKATTKKLFKSVKKLDQTQRREGALKEWHDRRRVQINQTVSQLQGATKRWRLFLLHFSFFFKISKHKIIFACYSTHTVKHTPISFPVWTWWNILKCFFPLCSACFVFYFFLRIVGFLFRFNIRNKNILSFSNFSILYYPVTLSYFLGPPGNHPRGAIFPTVD